RTRSLRGSAGPFHTLQRCSQPSRSVSRPSLRSPAVCGVWCDLPYLANLLQLGARLEQLLSCVDRLLRRLDEGARLYGQPIAYLACAHLSCENIRHGG
ncbi:hypothetical protein PMAYCL1PPCAC_13528, partial [Pristionchus mayeri]